jgi:glycosyltransferase involved in cell wall biosynthesis
MKIKKEFKKCNIPKISIISPLYNRGRYIIRLIKSIQYQYFYDIEIIFVDDCSIDNSIKKIEEIKNLDKRIILLKNKKNKGTFISRNLGVQFSKGKYIILPDPDDILSKNILRVCYNLAEKYNYEIIRFLQYKGNKKKLYSDMFNLYANPIYQPELSVYIFYGINELQIIDFFINNKFIKRELYIKSLNILNKSYLNMYILCFEDQIINYIIHRIAKSFYFLYKVGYYYIRNSISISKIKISGLKTKYIFIYLKLLFEYSKNNKYEKDISNIFFTDINKFFNIEKELASLGSKNSYQFYKDIVDIHLRSKFISNDNKYLLKNLEHIINKKN